MDVQRTRLDRLREQISRYESRAQFNAAAGVQDAQVYQWLSGRRAFGEKAARKLERSLGLRHGYFDSESALEYAKSGPVALQLAERVSEYVRAGKINDEDAAPVLMLIETLARARRTHA